MEDTERSAIPVGVDRQCVSTNFDPWRILKDHLGVQVTIDVLCFNQLRSVEDTERSAIPVGVDRQCVSTNFDPWRILKGQYGVVFSVDGINVSTNFDPWRILKGCRHKEISAGKEAFQPTSIRGGY